MNGRTGLIHQAPDLEPYPLHKTDVAFKKLDCVQRFRAMRVAGGIGWREQIIEQLQRDYPELKISQRTLYRWDTRHQGKSDLVKLIDKRGGRRSGMSGDAAAWDYFGALYLTEQARPALECWRLTKRYADEQGLDWPSYGTCQRQLKRRFDAQTITHARERSAYRNKLDPYIEQDPERFAAGECWVGDHMQYDFICRSGSRLLRPWLSAFQDWRTRRIVGWVISESPNSETIKASLLHGLKDPASRGGPRLTWIDNGKDYDAYVFHGQTKQQRRKRVLSVGYIEEPIFKGLFGLLDIEAHFAMAYNPRGKARMERWFGTAHGQFDRPMPTYCGANPQARPEGLAELLKYHPEQIPTMEQVNHKFSLHVQGFNRSADHQMEDLAIDGCKISPDQAMARWCTTQRLLPDERTMALLFQHWHKPVTVGRNGISLTIGGMRFGYGQFSDALRPFKGKTKADRRPVYVLYDPNDLRQIRVFDEQMRYIGTETMNETGGIHGAVDVDQIKRLQKRKAEYRKSTRFTNEHATMGVFSNAELLAMEPQEQPKPPTEPMQIKPVQTPLDHQISVIQADDFRQAAGAETTPQSNRSGLTSLEKLRQNQQFRRPDPDELDDSSDSPWTKLRRSKNG